jgi:hypothetical protein
MDIFTTILTFLTKKIEVKEMVFVRASNSSLCLF